MTELTPLVLFTLDEQRYALALDSVERIVRAVAVTVLPTAPDIVIGVIDVAGRVLPVLNLRRRFGLPERDVAPDDQFILARTNRRTVALAVDVAAGMIEYPAAAIVRPDRIAPRLGRIEGVVALDDGLVLIADLDNFLALDEAQAIDAAMSEQEAHAT